MNKRSPESRKRGPVFEFSSGGVPLNSQKQVLLIQVKNLRGDIVWTFPKGHLEQFERSPDAALREVMEETGWNCRIKQPLEKVQYWFKREGRLVKKTVTWFLMESLEKVGSPDHKEILDTCWCSLREASRRVVYPSDKTILKKLEGIITPPA